ncbi:MAG: NTP transferase domain-containing protein [Saprospiraceae bacterium]|nr:NTP transferase domain-containing protein [Saprospiraceae bacterium]
MKAVIPVAGAGTNLRPHTYTQPKPLIPVAGKAIISFIIDDLIAEGVDDFVFVIGYLGEKIKDYVEGHYPNIKKEFVVQHERMGSAHAIWTAKDAIQDAEEVFIFFGDTIIDADIKTMLESEHSCLAVKKVEDPRQFGVVEIGENDFVKKVVEKPTIPKSNLASVGVYKIKEVKKLLSIIQNRFEKQIAEVGEFPLTDAIMGMIEEGTKFITYPVDNWFDCGKSEILLKTNATLLDKEGYADEDLPTFYNTIIIHPVSIGKDCDIKNSIIGPHVTIGNNTEVHNSIISESIIGSFSRIEEIVLNQSLVGSDASIRGLSQRLNIGDNTEIDFT